MTLFRVIFRTALLSLAAVAFVGLTGIYGRSVRVPLPDPQFRAEHGHRAGAPQASYFLEFLGVCIELAIFTVAGRVVFRLRLTPPSRNEGKPVLLHLHQGATEPPITTDSQVGRGYSAINSS